MVFRKQKQLVANNVRLKKLTKFDLMMTSFKVFKFNHKLIQKYFQQVENQLSVAAKLDKFPRLLVSYTNYLHLSRVIQYSFEQLRQNSSLILSVSKS